jgi:hypothetical protein
VQLVIMRISKTGPTSAGTEIGYPKISGRNHVVVARHHRVTALRRPMILEVHRQAGTRWISGPGAATFAPSNYYPVKVEAEE